MNTIDPQRPVDFNTSGTNRTGIRKGCSILYKLDNFGCLFDKERIKLHVLAGNASKDQAAVAKH